jgi:hypothetical protein
MFLGAAAGAPLLARGNMPQAECHLVDLGSGCVLPESPAGFKLALQQLGLAQGEAASHLILPGAGALDEATVAAVHQQLGRGGIVLLECGFGFAEAGEFAGCCTPLRRGLGIEVGDLAGQGGYFPYVEYSWPVRAKIREFRPVWLLPAPGDEIIGTFGGRAVALRRRVGGGMLVAMGSPIGPVFLSDDPDARRWLGEFLRAPGG